MRIVDFNADGIPDLAVVSLNSSVVQLYPGIGDGTFGTPVTITLSFDPVDIAVGDINGDASLMCCWPMARIHRLPF